MQCDDVRERLSALIDGELDVSERQPVLAHVKSCEACAREEKALRALDRDLSGAMAAEGARTRELARAVAARLEAAPAVPGIRRFSMRSLALAVAAGFLLAVLVMRPWRSEPADAPVGKSPGSVATLDLAVGALEVMPAPGAAWSPLSTGAGVGAGTEIRCGPKTKASFQLGDGSELRLNRGSRLRFLDDRHLALQEGELYVHVSPAKPGGREFRVDAPGDSRVIALGTQLDVLALERGVRLVTLQGLAQLLDGRGGAREVNVGQQAEVNDGAVGAVTAASSLEMLSTWHVELLSLRGRDDRELAAIVDKLLVQLGRTKMENLYESEIRKLGTHCQLPLARFIESEDSKKEEWRRADAARILADIADASLRNDFLALLGDPQADVRYHAARALARIVGPSWSYTPEYWRDTPPVERESTLMGCKSEFTEK